MRLDISGNTQDIAIARSIAAAMAARADLTIDQLEDARLAVDEATAQLMRDCVDSDRIHLHFEARQGELAIEVSAPAHGRAEIARDTFSWTILSALATHADGCVDADCARISLHFQRMVTVEA